MFCLFHFLEKESNVKGPAVPNGERLIVAALAASGSNWVPVLVFSVIWVLPNTNELLASGTTPF
jgi:hypothetical protein